MSDTGKQQFAANQGVYQLSDKTRSVTYDIVLWRSVWTRLYLFIFPLFNPWLWCRERMWCTEKGW